MGSLAAANGLIEASMDRDFHVRLAVIKALGSLAMKGKLHDSRAVEVLKGALQDTSIEVREAAQQALLELG